MNNKIITIFGGSGFVARKIIKYLAKRNNIIRLISRDSEAVKYMAVYGFPGQINLINGDVNNISDIEKNIAGSDIVINLVGILFEKGKNSFDNLHHKAAALIAVACLKNNVEKFIHFSALGVDANRSDYAKTKLFGESEIFKNFPGATIIRPSVIFGEEDQFINRFSKMMKLSPVIPLVAGGKTKFQPIHVDDIAKLIDLIIYESDIQVSGKIIEVAGSDTYSFKQIIEMIAQAKCKKIYMINIPEKFALQLGKFLKYLPTPPLTDDQVVSLRYDNVIKDSNNLTLSDFGISPKPLEKFIKNTINRKDVQ